MIIISQLKVTNVTKLQKPHRKKQKIITFHVHLYVHWKQFSNLEAWNNSRRLDTQLKSITQKFDTFANRWVRLPNKCPGYDIKQSADEAPVWEIWSMWSSSSLRLFRGTLWPEW